MENIKYWNVSNAMCYGVNKWVEIELSNFGNYILSIFYEGFIKLEIV